VPAAAWRLQPPLAVAQHWRPAMAVPRGDRRRCTSRRIPVTQFEQFARADDDCSASQEVSGRSVIGGTKFEVMSPPILACPCDTPGLLTRDTPSMRINSRRMAASPSDTRRTIDRPRSRPTVARDDDTDAPVPQGVDGTRTSARQEADVVAQAVIDMVRQIAVEPRRTPRRIRDSVRRMSRSPGPDRGSG
jgi:hypothetical protein